MFRFRVMKDNVKTRSKGHMFWLHIGQRNKRGLIWLKVISKCVYDNYDSKKG